MAWLAFSVAGNAGLLLIAGASGGVVAAIVVEIDVVDEVDVVVVVKPAPGTLLTASKASILP